jgi:serine/threonine protein kinase
MEGVSASRLSHKNIVTILDSGISQEGIAYLIMELLHGRSLTKELDSTHRISLRRTCLILAQVCGALTEAHRHGIIHRDIKPDNIFLTQSSEGEVVKVVDFGISKRLVESNMESYYLTAKGGILGTPSYMSPERLAGAKYDEKADIYSVGIVFYEMVCGQPPFLFNTVSSRNTLWKHINEDPPSLKLYNSIVPNEVDKLLLTILSRNPEDRPSAEVLRQKLLLFAEEYKEIVFTRRLKKFSSAAADTLIRETLNSVAQSEDRSFVDEE